MMGGFGAHEYMAPSVAGEDRIVLCDTCSYAANAEMAVSRPTPAHVPTGVAIEEVATPGVTTIETLARTLGIEKAATLKSVIVVPEDDAGGIVLALVRGDHRVHDLKLGKTLGATHRPARADEIQSAFGADPGSIGAVGLRDGAIREVIVDEAATSGGYVAGANRTGYHLLNVEYGRDFAARVADIRHVEEGDGCAECAGTLRTEAAIEVGNIFKLGTRYAEAMNAKYLDEDGSEKPIWMGSYGVGPARILAAAVEQNADQHGIVWPQALSPFDVWITPIGDDALGAADELDQHLTQRGLAVTVDDRPLSVGVRFADADLIGVPLRVTIGKKLRSDGVIELRHRATGTTEEIALDAAAERIATHVDSAIWR
jgi:prolyl-tRNA synthetase